jgi:hypothetical protein
MPIARPDWLLEEPTADASYLFPPLLLPLPHCPEPGRLPAQGPAAPAPAAPVIVVEAAPAAPPVAEHSATDLTVAGALAAGPAPEPAAPRLEVLPPVPPAPPETPVTPPPEPVARPVPAPPAWSPDALLLLSFGREVAPLPPFQPPPRLDADLHATPGRDSFRFATAEAGRTIHDFEPGRDRVELRETRIADVVFETGEWDLRLVLTGGQALAFAGLGPRGHDAVAVVFADGVLSVAEMLDLAAGPADAPWPV